MLKPIASMLVLVTLAGCGASHGGLTSASIKAATGASARAADTTITIASATQTDGADADGGIPESETYALSGKDGTGPFTLLVKAVNPGGALYVPKPASVVLNGKAVAASAYGELGIRLQSAKVASDATREVVYRVGSILQLSN